MRNDFDKDELKKWFFYDLVCWACDKYHVDAFHHATGRDSNSMLNAVPLNNFECHLPRHAFLRDKATTKMFLEKTLKWLLSQGYKFNENDKAFIEKNREYYEDILEGETLI